MIESAGVAEDHGYNDDHETIQEEGEARFYGGK